MLPDLTGMTFGRLTVLGLHEGSPIRAWSCQCSCGGTKVATTKVLRNGRVKSCGCLWLESVKKANTTHGQSVGYKRSREFTQWHNMTNRCRNPKSDRWENYGARGVDVCHRWETFENFLEDMGECPEGMTLERNDVNLGYCLSNCRWATRTEQARNKSNTLWVEYQGATKCLATWCEDLGLKYNTVAYRLRSGWSPERAFNRLESR